MPSADPAPDRDVLAHLARNWNAQAAQIERLEQKYGWNRLTMKAAALRECAADLLELLGSYAAR